MAIQRWDPVRDLLGLRDRFNELFEDVLARSGVARDEEPMARPGWRPAMDLFEEPSRYVARIDLPGVAPADVEIEVDDTALRVHGERRMDLGVPREAYLRVERPQGRFSLSVQLPPSVDRGGIQAQHSEGVLEIVLPRRKEEGPSKVRVGVR
jgi:HSP20 family protein